MEVGSYQYLLLTYDRVIERFVMTNSTKWSLVDGFANLPGHGDCWNEQVYHTYISNTRHDNRKDIVLLKLHGSIFWYKRKGDDEIFRMPHSSRRDITLENVLLYPAQTKNTLIEPFKTCYDYLGECLANCKVCVVVGHSFRDPYILEKLKYAANKNGRFALLVIDPGNVEGKVLSIGKHCKWVPHKVGFGNIKIGNTLVEFERGLRSLLS